MTETLHTYEQINKALNRRRDQFTHEYKRGEHGSSVLTYEPEVDRQVYKTLKTFEKTSENKDFEKVQESLNDYTTSNVNTFIG